MTKTENLIYTIPCPKCNKPRYVWATEYDLTLAKTVCDDCLKSEKKAIERPIPPKESTTKERNKYFTQQQKDELKKEINDLKISTGCQNINCKWDGEFVAGQLHFHHKDPSTKSFSIAKSFNTPFITREDVFSEIDKCIVLCANCHTAHHC